MSGIQAIYGVGCVTLVGLVVAFLTCFDSLEYQEMGLNYNWAYETVQKNTFDSGRYYLGLGNHFIKFPKMVKSIYLTDNSERQSYYRASSALSRQYQGPSLQSRTRDGLNVRLEVSFQYRLKPETLYELYTTLGLNYEQILVRMAIEQLATSATQHTANFFFTNRTSISREMHGDLMVHFDKHAFATVPFFQLRTVHLPAEFEDAIKKTQVKQQEIQIARLEQKRKTVGFETTVLQAEQQVRVMLNQAEAEVQAVNAKNDAYCRQFSYTQELRADSLGKLMKASAWKPKQLLEYMRIRAMREHPSDKTMIRF